MTTKSHWNKPVTKGDLRVVQLDLFIGFHLAIGFVIGIVCIFSIYRAGHRFFFADNWQAGLGYLFIACVAAAMTRQSFRVRNSYCEKKEKILDDMSE